MRKVPEYTLRIPLRIFQLVPEEKRRLGLIVFTVALIHFLLFFTLEIHYPSSNVSSVRRTEIFLSSPDLMGAESWNSTLFWNQMRDPSALLHQALIPDEKSKLLRPVFETVSNSNLPLLPVGSESESTDEKLLPLENKAFEKMVLVPKSFNFAVNPSTMSHHTQSLYSKNLDERLSETEVEWPIAKVSLLNESHVTTIRLGVSMEGFVIHAMIEESSGSNALDQIALQEIRKQTFQAKPKQELEWGSVTIFWVFSNPPPKQKEGT